MGLVKAMHLTSKLCCTLLTCITLLLTPVLAHANEQINLQLKWKHAFQFAGFYMAKEKGFYDDAGLQVNLIEGGPGKPSSDFTLQNEGNYGVADTGALLSHAEGKPIKALAAIFQHSPLALAVRKNSGIRNFSDLRGKRVMMQANKMDAVLLASLKKAGLSQSDFIRQDSSFDIQDLILGHTDAFSIYITDQPHQLIEQGIAHRILSPSQYNIDFYGDILITSEKEIHQHPERVQSFLKASMDGWSYALEHVDETIEIIQSKYNTQNLSSGQLYFEAARTADMMFKDLVNPGYMNLHRWKQIAQTYADLELIPQDYPVEQFLYVPEPELSDFITQYRWQLMIATLCILLLIFAFQSTLLRRMVRHRTQDLHASETRFRTLVDNIPGAVFRYHPDHSSDMDFISSEIEVISGYPATDFTNNTRPYHSIIHADDQAAILNTIEHGLKHGTPYAYEYRIIRADGTQCWVLESGQPSSSPNQDRWIDGYIFNITERKEAERLKDSISEILEMVASDKNLDQIFNAIIHSYENRYPGMKATILRVIDGRLRRGAAPNLPEIYNNAIDGLEIGPMVGSCGTAAFNKKRTIAADIEHDPRWAPYLELTIPLNLRACWSEPICNSEGKVIGTFGMYYDHVRSPAPEEIRDIANAAKLTGIAMEREQHLKQLKKLSQAIEQSSEVITILDSKWVIEYINPAFTEVTGFRWDDVIGKTSPTLHRDNNEAIVQQAWQALDQGHSWRGRVTEQRKDGSFYPAMLAASPVRDENSKISHFICVLEDLSQLQQMEAQFHQAQKMESIGTLVGGIAHDFNNMLAALQGNLYMARRHLTGNAVIIDKLNNMEQLANHAANMVKQLLTFARKDRVDMKPLPLNSFIKEAFKLASRSIPESIACNIDICEEKLVIIGDATQLQQILMNLLNNAHSAVSHALHPTINCSVHAFTVTDAFLRTHPEAETENRSFAHICIQDNGSGIPDAISEKIFEPFFTTKNVGEGTGLGLAMVYGAIKTHAGYIDMESNAETGTAFHLYLPLADTQPGVLHVDPHFAIEGKGETILLVDDEPNLRGTTAEVLNALGYHIIEAENGQIALDIFKEKHQQIDLIITDMIMPIMGGSELSEHIRHINTDMPIIFSSGYDREQSFEIDKASPHTLFLQKPCAIEILSQSLRQLLDAKK
ncbi:ABC transporter substrate-binding protein [Mariprofundus sp. EBB-1]|uniref:ABC transporter substrate-binding protein n=1 Tax=Mariprofundus sp. EBB-1 TaxID=2650971 RepID=UPI0013796EDA|nr:ABC transporter substrate-binding protein [Mariprofundus sp. EBB-1]